MPPRDAVNFIDEHGFVTTLENCKVWKLKKRNMAVLVYDIIEVSMGADYGRVAVVEEVGGRLKVIESPKLLKCFLSGRLSGIYPFDNDKMGELVLINYDFIRKRQSDGMEDSENPFVFLRIKDLMVSVLRLDNACAFQIASVNDDVMHFVKVPMLRKDLDEKTKDDFTVDIGQCAWHQIALFDEDVEFFTNWYFSLHAPIDRVTFEESGCAV